MTVPPRSTRQRSELLSLLGAGDGFRTAQEIHAKLRASGVSVGLATVYRNLAALVQSAEVDCITRDGETRYRRCSSEHHHHLLCRKCGKTVEVQAATFESWCRSTARAHGFKDIDHTVEILGTCADCSN